MGPLEIPMKSGVPISLLKEDPQRGGREPILSNSMDLILSNNNHDRETN